MKNCIPSAMALILLCHNMIRLVFLLLLAFIPGFTTVCAQDLHYSQFYNNPVHNNPASTGLFAGNLRANLHYRSQWEKVPVQYRTQAAGVEWKAMQKASTQITIGLLLQHDGAGDASLQWTQAGLNLALARTISNRQTISAGFGTALVQRSVDVSDLTFKNQWADGAFDASRPTKENFNRSSGLTPSLAAGLSWQYMVNHHTRIQVGGGAFHLNPVNVNLVDDGTYILPKRWSGQVSGTFQIHPQYDLVLFGMYQTMLKNNEIITGGGIRFWLADVPGNHIAAQVTMATRPGDALIPAFQIDYNAWTFGLSYDWNTSPFKIATQGRGGLELSLIYRALPVSQVPVFKACPIF